MKSMHGAKIIVDDASFTYWKVVSGGKGTKSYIHFYIKIELKFCLNQQLRSDEYFVEKYLYNSYGTPSKY